MSKGSTVDCSRSPGRGKGPLKIFMLGWLVLSACGGSSMPGMDDTSGAEGDPLGGNLGTQGALGAKPLPPSFQGGPVLQPELVALYWGNITARDVLTMDRYLAGLVGYMSGVNAPLGQKPVTDQYGVHGGSIGAAVCATGIPSTGHAVKEDVAAELSTLQASGGTDCQTGEIKYLLAYGPERIFVVFTKGIKFDDMPDGACGDHGAWGQGQYYARVPLEFACKLSGKTVLASWQSTTSHEVFEAATDPIPGSGWYPEIGDACTGHSLSMPFGMVQTCEEKLRRVCSTWTP
jgi:hypothetical protein